MDQIVQYQNLDNTKGWNPCIPMTFTEDKTIVITFDNTKTWRNWYPLDICDYPNNAEKYQNEYLFDGAKSLTFNNLTISDYTIDHSTNYPIVRSVASTQLRDPSAVITIEIINATLANISSSITQPLFYSISNIHIINSHFSNLEVLDVIFYGYGYVGQIESPRSFIFSGSIFANITAKMLFESTLSKNDVK